MTKPTTRTPPHEWKDGACTICGYECVHTDYEAVLQPGAFVPTGEWKFDGASGYSHHGRIETQTKCGNCGFVLGTSVTDANTT